MSKNSSNLKPTEDFRVPPDSGFKLSTIDPNDTFGLEDKKDARKQLNQLHEKLEELQEKLYAQGKYGVLFVLQAIDTGGKDSTIRRVFGPLNPQGVRVTSYKKPSVEELSHDYLWRIHRKMPRKGMIRIFNRSHYEDVLVVRVHGLAPMDDIEKRYYQINAFEQYLHENDITIVKIMLHISKEEQKERFLERLENKEKHWKFSTGDLKERARWDDYMTAFEIALNRCSTFFAPWYVIPANHKWARDVMIAQIVVETLEKLDLKYPDPEEGLENITIPD
jgi:PPK2 family polyphosphate:nucleotide phosphotransferase